MLEAVDSLASTGQVMLGIEGVFTKSMCSKEFMFKHLRVLFYCQKLGGAVIRGGSQKITLHSQIMNYVLH